MRWKYSKVSHIFLTFETKTIWLFYSGYFPFAWRVLQKIPILFFNWCYVNLTDSRHSRIWSCTSPELWIFTSLYTEVVLFFISFKSPAVFIFYHARSTDFEQKIEGLWTGSIFTGHAWSYEILICFILIQVTYSWHTNEYLRQSFAIRRGQHSQNC